MRASTPWDDVETLVLTAARTPVTVRQVAVATGLTPDTAQAQLEVLRRDGFLTQLVDTGVRYQMTLTGRQRLTALTTRPGQPAAA